MENPNTPNHLAKENYLYYSGDCSPENHGGAFFNLNLAHRYADGDEGYIEAMRVFRLDDGPFSSLVLIESLTLLADDTRVKEGLDCIGVSTEEYERADSQTRLAMEAEGLLSCGHYDPMEFGYEHHTAYVQVEQLDKEALDTLETAGMKPSHNSTGYYDPESGDPEDEGEIAFDETRFYEILQSRILATFSDTHEDACWPECQGCYEIFKKPGALTDWPEGIGYYDSEPLCAKCWEERFSEAALRFWPRERLLACRKRLDSRARSGQ